MNKLYANVVQAHRKAWANHLKKVMHSTENRCVSRVGIHQSSVPASEMQLSRWGRRFHQDN